MIRNAFWLPVRIVAFSLSFITTVFVSLDRLLVRSASTPNSAVTQIIGNNSWKYYFITEL